MSEKPKFTPTIENATRALCHSVRGRRHACDVMFGHDEQNTIFIYVRYRRDLKQFADFDWFGFKVVAKVMGKIKPASARGQGEER